MNICNSQQTDKISIQHFKMSRLPMTLIDKSILFEMKYQECVSKSNFEVRFPHNRFDYFCFMFQMEKRTRSIGNLERSVKAALPRVSLLLSD